MTDEDAPHESQTPSIDARRNATRDQWTLERSGLLPGGWANLGSAMEELVTLNYALEDVVAMGAEREAELLRARAKRSERVRSKEAEGELSPEQAREALDKVARQTAYEHTPEWWAEMQALDLAAVARGMISALESGNPELALAVAARKLLSLSGPSGGDPEIALRSSRLADRWRGFYAHHRTHAGGAAPKKRAGQFSEAEREELLAKALARRRDNPRLSQEQSVTGLSLEERAMPDVSPRHLAELLFHPRSRAAPLEAEDDPDTVDSSGQS